MQEDSAPGSYHFPMKVNLSKGLWELRAEIIDSAIGKLGLQLAALRVSGQVCLS